VNEEFLGRSDVYNLQPGGGGGFSKWHEEHAAEFHQAGYAAMQAKKDHSKTSALIWSRHREKMLPTARASAKKASDAALNEISREKRRATFAKIGHQSGEKNSNFGKAWIHRGTEKPMMVAKQTVEEYLKNGYVLGRKARRIDDVVQDFPYD
jgi:hypothetical protein